MFLYFYPEKPNNLKLNRKFLYEYLLENKKDFPIEKFSSVEKCIKFSLNYIRLIDEYIGLGNNEEIIFELDQKLIALVEDVGDYEASNRLIAANKKILDKFNKTSKKNKSVDEYYGLYIQNLNRYYQSVVLKDILISDYLKIRNCIEYEYSINKRMNKIFLSSAYSDKLLTLCLFIFFYNNGIYLYVDWMNNPRINDSRKLKTTLQREMEECNQFVLLRTPDSEINNSDSLRQWCSWEMGCYRGLKGSDDQFIIDTISYGKEIRNLIYKDLYRIDGIDNGKLYGKRVDSY